jgi:uncharacterized protein
MPMTEITYDEAMPIDSYGPGFFRIAGQVLRGPVMVSPWGAGPWGGLDDAATPLALTGRIDVIFLGMGADIAHAPAALRAQLEEAGMGVEVMNSPAACRTYNVLLSEGRRVACLLLPV